MEATEFEEIALKIRPKLTAHCQRYLETSSLVIDAEDIVQETLVRLWKMGDKLHQYQSVEALSKTIANHLYIDHIRQNKEVEGVAHTLENVENPERADQAIIGEDTQRRLNKAIEKLPATQRRMLMMRSDGMSLDEIADICGANKTSTKSMISAARRTLLKLMKQ